MMQYRFFTLLIAFVLAFSVGHAQKKNKGSATPAPKDPDAKEALIEMYKDILNQSLSFNDLSVATDATYALMALQPEDSMRIDTLAAIYFQRGAYPQTIMVGTQILESRPGDVKVMEMMAISKAQLGASLEALADYEKVYAQTNDAYHLYEIASLQYTVRRYGECEMSVKKLLEDPGIKGKEVTLTFKQGQQKVPLNAAIQNLWGVLDLDQGKQDSAKQHFMQAVQLFPDFYLAKANLDALNKKP